MRYVMHTIQNAQCMLLEPFVLMCKYLSHVISWCVWKDVWCSVHDKWRRQAGMHIPINVHHKRKNKGHEGDVVCCQCTLHHDNQSACRMRWQSRFVLFCAALERLLNRVLHAYMSTVTLTPMHVVLSALLHVAILHSCYFGIKRAR